MRRLVPVASVVLALSGLLGCGGGGGGGSEGGGGGGGATVSFASQVQPIFDNYCVLCHTQLGSASFLHLTPGESRAGLVNVASMLTAGGGLRVAPFDSASSVLWKRVSGIGLDVSEAVMPPGFTISEAERSIVRTWIDEGALDN